MHRTQFWILTCSSILTGLLFLLQIYVAREDQAANREFQGMERLIQQGQQCNNIWQQVALRTYQLSQQNPALKDLLVRQQIKITPKPTTNPVALPVNPTPASTQ